MPNLAQMQMPPLPPAVAVAIFYRQLVVTGLVLAVLVALAYRFWPRRPSERAPVISERALLIRGLGVLWALDGLLQTQPLMVTRFLSGVVAPLMAGEPGPLADLLRFGVQVWGINPISANVFATFSAETVSCAGPPFGRPSHGASSCGSSAKPWAASSWAAAG